MTADIRENKVKMTTSKSDPNRMTTRCFARLSPNGKNKETNKETLDLYEMELETIINNDRTVTIPKLRDEFNNGDITADEFKIEIYKLKGRVAELFEVIDEIKDLIKHQDKKIEIQDKKIENQAIQSSIEIKEIKEDIEALEQDNKDHLKETLNIKQKAHDNNFDIRGLKKEMEKHSLKLNASNGWKGGAWALHSDTDLYPILKSDDRNYHYTKFQDNLKPVKLKGPKLTDIRDFWRAINVAFMSTLQSNKGFTDYESLDSYYSIETDIVPPLGHTQHNQGYNAYKQFGAILLGHLKKEGTIEANKSQRAYTSLKENSMIDDGFKVLWVMIQNSSPQLGGDARDLQRYVTTLKLTDGETLLDFYICALEMLQEITIQKDTTGQGNRLIRRFVSLLSSLSQYSQLLHKPVRILNEFFRQPDNTNKTVKLTLEKIYTKYLKDSNASKIISINQGEKNSNVGLNDSIVAKNDASLHNAIVNAGRMSREDIDRHRNHTQDKRVTFDRRTQSSNGGSGFTVKRCNACGLTNKELHHAIRTLHTCEPGTCFIRGPKYNSDKEIRENVNQYNLKNMKDKGVVPDKNRLGIRPKEATLPNPNVNHMNNDDDQDSEEGGEYDYSDTIDPDEYNLQDDYEEEELYNEERIP